MKRNFFVAFLVLIFLLSGCHQDQNTATQVAPTLTAQPSASPEPTTTVNTPQPTVSPTNRVEDVDWWQDAVFYLIFVRSFYDSNGDGIGDFAGITQKLDYLNDGDPATTTDLGINAIWLMPIMDSPSEHGYDVRDFYATNPQYGTLDEFKELLAQAHQRGIHVIIDFIIHNTSAKNPWFIQSQDPKSTYRDWYLWSETDPGWRGPWNKQVWYPLNGQYIYAYFWEGSPNLNLANPEVTAEMKKLTAFWLNDVGVDGFRLDAIGTLIPEGSVTVNTSSTHRWLKEYHDYSKGLKNSAFTVGEIWDKNEVVIPYVQNNEIDLAFNFDLAFALIRGINELNPSLITEQVKKGQDLFPEGRYATFATNHDMDRLMTQLGNDPRRVKAAASIYLTLPEVPFIYYGEEVGLEGYAPDSGGRLPMQWSGDQNAGFTTGRPWLPPGADYELFNVQNGLGKPLSLFTHYQKLIALRNEYEVIRRGKVQVVDCSDPNMYSTMSVLDGEAVITLVNISGRIMTDYQISVQDSTLPAGSYTTTSLLGDLKATQIEINSSGGFTDFNPGTSITSYGTVIIHLK